MNNTTQPKPFKSVPTSYGNKRENCKDMHQMRTKNHVRECGFVVNPLFPFLGATPNFKVCQNGQVVPDGKVCQKGQSGILEVKCSYIIREWNI